MKRFGDTVPESITDKPTIPLLLAPFLEAFFDLDTERSLVNFDPIPWSAVDYYAMRQGFHGVNREDLFLFIRKMDNAYVKALAEKQKQK